jgi:hypothetical protein
MATQRQKQQQQEEASRCLKILGSKRFAKSVPNITDADVAYMKFIATRFGAPAVNPIFSGQSPPSNDPDYLIRKSLALLRWMDRVCAQCRAKESQGAKLSSCGGCLLEFYCSAACQRNHWRSQHKGTCGRTDAPWCKDGPYNPLLWKVKPHPTNPAVMVVDTSKPSSLDQYQAAKFTGGARQ